MANEINTAIETKESLTATASARDIAADVLSASRDALTGDRYGVDVSAEVLVASRDALTGDRVGINWVGGATVVWREVIVSQAPFNMANSWRESLVSRPNDPINVSHMVRGYKQQVTMKRPTMALPGTVHSFATVSTLRAQVVMKNVRAMPRSGVFVGTLRQQYVAERITLPADLVRSTTRATSLRQQVVLSRDQVYIPVSAVYATSLRQQAVQHRVVPAAPTIRSPLYLGALSEQVVLSRRVAAVLTDVFVGQLVMQSVLKDTRPAPHSPTDVMTLAALVVQKHAMPPPGIDDRVGALVQQAVMVRDPDLSQIGEEQVAALAQHVVMQREVVAYASPAIVGSYVQQAVLHRPTYPPALAQGRQTATLVQKVALARTVGPQRSLTRVAQLRVQYTLFRKTPKPVDVIDPALGHHVRSLHHLAVQHRVTVPPEHLPEPTHYLFALAQQAAIRDIFPPPDYPPVEASTVAVFSAAQGVVLRDTGTWTPISSVRVSSALQSAVVGDNAGWDDPFIPYSDAQVFNAAMAVAVGDVFPAGDSPQSEAQVVALTEAVAFTDDSFPSADTPQAAVEVLALAQAPVTTDPDWPDPTVPVSDAAVHLVAEAPVVADTGMYGQFELSDIQVMMVVRCAVVSDPALVGITKRTGPRPIVSVSIS